MDASVSATFERIGRHAEKAIAPNILLENAYKSNLVPDILREDHTPENNAGTYLRPLEGLPIFVDKLYIFSYLGQNDGVVSMG